MKHENTTAPPGEWGDNHNISIRYVKVKVNKQLLHSSTLGENLSITEKNIMFYTRNKVQLFLKNEIHALLKVTSSNAPQASCIGPNVSDLLISRAILWTREGSSEGSLGAKPPLLWPEVGMSLC